MRYFFRRRIPQSPRILLVESGSRRPLERALPALHAYFGQPVTMDVLTCASGVPNGLRMETTTMFDVNDYRGARRRLLGQLRRNKYAVMGMLCSGEPIRTKWKWTLAVSLPAKIFANEGVAQMFVVLVARLLRLGFAFVRMRGDGGAAADQGGNEYGQKDSQRGLTWHVCFLHRV